MQRTLIIGVGGLVIGVAIGFWLANSLNRSLTVTGSLPADHPTMLGQGTAQDDIQQLIELSEREPQNFAVQMRTGDLYAQIGRYDSAIEFYKRGIELRPDDTKAQLVLGNAYFDARKFDLAAEQYAKVVAAEPENHDARSDMAGALIEKDPPELDRALSELQKVVAAIPDHNAAIYYSALAHIKRGEKEKAVEFIERLRRSRPDSHLITRLDQLIAQN
jgi:tetratricopeptide (TPR) repeat protein